MKATDAQKEADIELLRSLKEVFPRNFLDVFVWVHAIPELEKKYGPSLCNIDWLLEKAGVLADRNVRANRKKVSRIMEQYKANFK